MSFPKQRTFYVRNDTKALEFFSSCVKRMKCEATPGSVVQQYGQDRLEVVVNVVSECVDSYLEGVKDALNLGHL